MRRTEITVDLHPADSRPLAEKAGEFCAQAVQRRLQQSGLSAQQQMEAVDEILRRLRETGNG